MERADQPVRRGRVYRRLAWVLIMIGIGGLAGAGWLYFDRPDSPALRQRPVGVADAPSAEKPSQQEIESYTVPADAPKYISIPAIHVAQTRIKQLGLLKDNQIASPDNIYDAGWYNGSAKPGQDGAMFIFGHVSSWEANGIFHDLNKLRPGDTVTITRGDGRQFAYRVTGSKTYPHDKVDMGAVLSPSDPHKPGLNLMTCAGHIIKGTSEFSERLVVFTVLEQ